MERFKLGLPHENDIISKRDFIINDILPICIIKINKTSFRILFKAIQACTEESIILQIAFYFTDDIDPKFINNHGLNVVNIANDFERVKFYNDATENLSDSVFATDFNMVELDNKPYFAGVAAKAIHGDKAELLNLLITRDNFIKINLFINRLKIHDNTAESIFISHKLHNMKFTTINRVKLDGSASDISSRIVCSHYSVGNGPEVYKFNFISAKLENRKLIRPVNILAYNNFYSNNFVISDLIYEPLKDILYVIYEVRSDITDKYKETKILRFTKEFYDKTNLIDIFKIYEGETNEPA